MSWVEFLGTQLGRRGPESRLHSGLNVLQYLSDGEELGPRLVPSHWFFGTMLRRYVKWFLSNHTHCSQGR